MTQNQVNYWNAQANLRQSQAAIVQAEAAKRNAETNAKSLKHQKGVSIFEGVTSTLGTLAGFGILGKIWGGK